MATETIQATDHKLYVAGEWMETGEWSEVNAPYDGTLIGRVPKGDAALVGKAVDAAAAAFEAGDFPQHERARVLDKAAEVVAEREDDLTMTIAAEAGKPVKTARAEAQRCVSTMQFSAVAARTLTGELVPMEAGAAGEGKLGIVIRVPYGVVGAISPFNFPLNLVAHKLGPAIAAGNAVVLKPAGQTPISAIKLVETLYDAGLPDSWIQLVCGSGSEVGSAIVENDRVGAITFTGSAPVGWDIRAKAARKQVNLELGSTAPLIIHEDGDWETAADKAKLRLLARRPELHLRAEDPRPRVGRGRLYEALRLQCRVAGHRRSDGREHRRRPADLAGRPRPGEVVGRRGRVRGAELLTGGQLVDEDRCLAPTVIKGDPRYLARRDLRTRGDDPHLQDVRRGDRDGQRRALRTSGRSLHPRPRPRDRGRQPARVRRRPGERGADLPHRPDALRRRQGLGQHPRGPYAVRELTEERLVTFQA